MIPPRNDYKGLIVKTDCIVPLIAKGTLAMNRNGEFHDFKTCYKVTVINILCIGIKACILAPRKIDKWNKTEADVDPQIHGQIIFDECAKAIQCRNYHIDTQIYIHMQKNEFLSIAAYTKTNSKCILNLKQKKN